MKDSRVRSPFRRNAFGLALLLLLPLVGLAGCDAITGNDDDDSIQGTWVDSGGTFPFYLEITNSSVTVYDGEEGGCFYIERYTIVSSDGDTYTLEEQTSSFQADVVLRVVDGDLHVTLSSEQGSETEVYTRSDQDVSQFEECTVDAGGGGDPSITCSELPAITVGQTINGELTTGDAMDSGRYFDLYGLTLGSQTQVQIDAMSDPVDTYLYLYGADGTYITENDDADSSTFDSRISMTLDAGCYRVEMTSWGDGETGAYTLSVN